MMDGEEVPEDILQLADWTESRYEIMVSIVDIADNHEGIWFRIFWEGLTDERDYTWYTIASIYEDNRDIAVGYLRHTVEMQLPVQAAADLGIYLWAPVYR